MRFFAPVFAIVALATTVIADGASIQAALDEVSAKTVKLDKAVTGWDGKLLTALPIVGASTELLLEINSATKIAEESEPLSNLEALAIARSTDALGKTVVAALGNIEAAKPKFDKLILSPVILLNLKAQNSATEKLGEAIMAKIPELLKPIALRLLEPISTAFDSALETYKLF